METKTKRIATVCRKAYFNAAHRLHCDHWSEEKNKEVFGICNGASFHGHNYELIVKVRGEIDAETGMVYDMKKLKDLIKEHIEARYDHKNLNTDLEEFQNMNPSTENLAAKIWEILRGKIDSSLELSIVLYETPRNFVEFTG